MRKPVTFARRVSPTSSQPRQMTSMSEQPAIAIADNASSDYLLGATLRLSAHCDAELSEASGHLDRAAASGLPAASFCLGVMYLRGEGVAQDSGRGYELIKDAAYHGYDRAQIYLIALDVLTGTSDDPEARNPEHIESLHRSARTGNAAAAFTLGTMKIAGVATVPDFIGGEILLRDASRKGNLMAALAVDLLEYLETSPANAEAGTREQLTCRAARLGFVSAISFLVLNFGLEAGPIPYRELLECTEKATARGDRSAERFKRLLLSADASNGDPSEGSATN